LGRGKITKERVMKLDTNNTGGGAAIDFKPIPAGVYEARVVKIAELGSQKAKAPYDKTPEGKPKGPSNKVSVTFEIPDQTIEIDGKKVPRLAFKMMTASMHEKAHLSKIAASAGLSGAFDSSELLGTVVSLTVTNKESNGRIYANVDAIAPVSARVAVTVPEAETEFVEFSFDNPNIEVFNSLPEFQRNMIKEAQNFKGSKVETMLFDQVEVAEDVVDDMEDDSSEGAY
jgi:hypothetical protein